ncbi:hypothetical protein CVO74_21350 [Xanthomonas prunicola]|uniref:Uncharacterized protein n=1 Tax=Xanthomonas prunicola TaxID=2053930 RepID=A0A2N3RF34_9XANT|nr:hypothetical protein XpruCFBP8353_20075 [Xanthomonas prunicola]PKV15258.1 hypothetical protein XpruCFBP8354_20195 [Xanthomonas prunicola]PKV19550.1 hypothetical protein CVO74_21350 [Xanthomonas prunicola]
MAVCRRALTPTPAPRPGPRLRRGRSKARAPVARKPCLLAPQAGEGLHGSARRTAFPHPRLPSPACHWLPLPATAFPRPRGKVPEGRMGARRGPIKPAVLTLLGTTPCKVERSVGCAA